MNRIAKSRYFAFAFGPALRLLFDCGSGASQTAEQAQSAALQAAPAQADPAKGGPAQGVCTDPVVKPPPRPRLQRKKWNWESVAEAR